MNVQVNGEPHTFDDAELSIVDLLAALSLGPQRGIAVAINMTVVPKSRWDAARIVDGDEIEIVRATQGG